MAASLLPIFTILHVQKNTASLNSTPFPHNQRRVIRLKPGGRGISVVARVEGRGQPDSPSEARPPLAQLCHVLELSFFEVCVRNQGRPAGLALHEFVTTTVEAFVNGYTWEQVTLQITFGSTGMDEFELGTAGSTLTATEEYYRSKWLATIYTTLQILKIVDNEASRPMAIDDMQLYSTVHHVIQGQQQGDVQESINFDRGLATKGASGGVVTEKVVIAPQWMPISQLVLLTLKVVNEWKW